MQEFRHDENPDDKVRMFSQAESEQRLLDDITELHARMAEEGYTETKRVRVGRNSKCPCGSKKKFKKCCMSKVGKRIKI